MALNTVTCGNCQTENPPDADFCVECGQPLTGSADEAIRENIDAQDGGSFIGNDDVGGASVAPGLAGGAGGIPTHLVPGDDAGRNMRDW